MDAGNFTLHWRARTIFFQLEPDERERVLESLRALGNGPATEWPADRVRKLAGDEPDYLVKIDDSLRAFVHAPAGQRPEVEDLARQEQLDFFAEAARKAGL
jgi:hypothetical protein